MEIDLVSEDDKLSDDSLPPALFLTPKRNNSTAEKYHPAIAKELVDISDDEVPRHDPPVELNYNDQFDDYDYVNVNNYDNYNYNCDDERYDLDDLNKPICLSSSSSDNESNSDKIEAILPVKQTADVVSNTETSKRRKLTPEEKKKKLEELELKKGQKAKQQEERKRKQELREEEKRRKTEARKAAKAEKQVEKEREKLLKKIENESNRNFKPDQSIKFLKVMIDNRLMDLPIGPVLVPLLQSAGIKHEVKRQTVPNCITWKREVVESSLSQELEIEENRQEVDENEILIYLPLEEFLNYVEAFKQRNRDFNLEKSNLISYARSVKNLYPGKSLTFVIEGYEQYSRRQKTSAQRKFRGAVLDEEATQNAPTKRKKKTNDKVSVTDIDVEECTVAILVQEACTVRFVDSIADVASAIINYTRAIAAAPFKRAKYQSQVLLQSSESHKGVKVKDSGEGLLLLWQKQIEMFNLVTADAAQAIVSKYPSPISLLEEYNKCLCTKEKEKLLQDILVRRGTGPLATTRRIGPELSRRMYLHLTAKNPDLNLHAS